MEYQVVLVSVVVAWGLAACELPPGTESGTSSSSSSGSGATGSVSSLKPINEDVLCARLIQECFEPLTTPACRRSFGSLRVTDDCLAALEAAPCSDLSSPSSAVSRTCFPPCSGALATCNSDGTLTFCSDDGLTRVADCNESCLNDGYTRWTGVCGTTKDGQTAPRAQCWCE